MGKLTIVGFGPGGRADMTVRAVEAIESADIVTGYTTYVDLLREAFPDKTYKATGMMKEIDRCRMAIEDAEKGRSVAMVSSGDSGIYGMTGLIYELLDEMGADIEVEAVPGVTAASSSAAILGAPLMHDTALISLSDLMTPIEKIMRRVDCAGQADFVIALYNPKSKHRTEYLGQAADILMRHRPPETPVGVVRNAGRRGESHYITTLGELKGADVDMFCTVIIGNSQTYAKGGRMITPRGYAEKYGTDRGQSKDTGCEKTAFEITTPREIEAKSMETIERELNGRTWPEPEFSIVKRCIHTSADFDYADNLVFSENAASIGVEALRNGVDVVTDTKMAMAGINRNRLASYGGDVHCYISDADVIEEAKARGCTRSTVSMERGAGLGKPAIFVVGNAPTALVAIHDLIQGGRLRPTLVVGVPVGFVNVVESKELIMADDVPYIVARGRKGGSNIGAAIINAMLYSMGRYADRCPTT